MEEKNCKQCDNQLILKQTKKTAAQQLKPYYYTAYYWCTHCHKLYHDEKFKVTNIGLFGSQETRVKQSPPIPFSFSKYDVEIWTDGACVHNGTPRARAAWAFVSGKTERSGLIEGKQTNNVAEALAIYEALAWAAENRYKTIKLHTDSQISLYNMKKQPGQIKVNAEIFAKIFTVISQFALEVDFIKVLGHSGDINNERADRLANGLVTKLIR